MAELATDTNGNEVPPEAFVRQVLEEQGLDVVVFSNGDGSENNGDLPKTMTVF